MQVVTDRRAGREQARNHAGFDPIKKSGAATVDLFEYAFPPPIDGMNVRAKNKKRLLIIESAQEHSLFIVSLDLIGWPGRGY